MSEQEEFGGKLERAAYIDQSKCSGRVGGRNLFVSVLFFLFFYLTKRFYFYFYTLFFFSFFYKCNVGEVGLSILHTPCVFINIVLTRTILYYC